MRGPVGFSSSRASVAMRSETSAGLGDTRSYGRQSQAGKRRISASGTTKASASASRAMRASSRVDVQDGPGELAAAPGQQEGVPALRRAADRCSGHRTPAPPTLCRRAWGEDCASASLCMRRSIGVSASAGSAGGRSASRPGRCPAVPAAPPAPRAPTRVSASMCRCTKPPIRMSFSYVPRCVARNSRRRRLASSEACSGSVIGAVSYSRAITPCQPVEHDPLTPLFRAPDHAEGHRPDGRRADRQGGGRRAGDRPAVPSARVRTSIAASARRSRRRGRARSRPWRSRWCGTSRRPIRASPGASW